jgi:hypothetical protein
MLNVKRVVVESTDGKEIWVTPAQADILNDLTNAHGGGCASIHGYRPTSGYVESPVVDLQVLTRFSTAKLMMRKLEAIRAIKFQDAMPGILRDEVLSEKNILELKELFDTRHTYEMSTITKTQDGDRSDAHRQGHDRCFATFGDGVKCHLFTEKNPTDKKMYPIKLNGLSVLESIKLPVLELARKVVTEGVSKPKPNSRAPKRMSNVINALLNSRSVGYKTLALKEDNFDKLVISGMEVLPEDVSPTVLDLLRD